MKSVIDHTFDPERIADLISRAKRLAREYRKRTGRPLGVTGEIAEYEAARLLDLRLAPCRSPGFDAVQVNGKKIRRLQIKARVVLDKRRTGQRLGKIGLKHKWDAALLVELDESLNPLIIHEASRARIRAALLAPGSKARNERGQLSLRKFRSISRVVWQRET